MKMKTLSLVLVLSLLFGILFSFAIETTYAKQTSGMVSYWTFDESSGTTAYDAVGTNDGTLINGPVWTTGIVDGALSFDGVDDYVSVADSAGLCQATITVECWAKIDNVPDSGAHIVDKILWGTEGYALMVQPSGVAQFAVVTDSGNTFHVDGTTNIVGDGNFHHIAGTYDGVKVRIYVDGMLEGSTDASGSIVYSGLFDLTIGDNNPISVRRRVKGLVDEVAIYDRVLTEKETKRHYQNGLRGFSYYRKPPRPGASKQTLDVWVGHSVGQTLDNTKSFAIARCDDTGTLKVNLHLHKSNQAGNLLTVWVRVDGGSWQLMGSFTPNEVGNGDFEATISDLTTGLHDVVVAINGAVTLYINSASAAIPGPPYSGIQFECP